MATTARPPRARVLVVEDHAASRAVLGVLLDYHGYEVRTAPDGPSGLDEAVRWRPDVVVSDIGLPGLDGWELAARARARLGGAVLLVALTGHNGPGDRERSLQAGFDHHLPKPADLGALLRLLGRG
ncbi:MAG: response regulator [Gemmataceae bacterium]